MPGCGLFGLFNIFLPNKDTLMGFYPPINSHIDRQYNNRTSRDINNVFKHYSFNWNDLFTFAPGATCSEVVQNEL